jgi:hypothetical protein
MVWWRNIRQQADVECTRSQVLRSSAVALEHWLCKLDAGTLNLVCWTRAHGKGPDPHFG